MMTTITIRERAPSSISKGCRIDGRWLKAADRLLGDPHSGFAVLALDCIVLESIWGFMNGKAVPRGGEQRVYREMLVRSNFGFTANMSDSFRELVRIGIIHDAETRHRWLVEKTVPKNAIVRQTKSGDTQINRTKFHQALKEVFREWIGKLRGGDTALRGNMRERMNQIVRRHRTP